MAAHAEGPNATLEGQARTIRNLMAESEHRRRMCDRMHSKLTLVYEALAAVSAQIAPGDDHYGKVAGALRYGVPPDI